MCVHIYLHTLKYIHTSINEDKMVCENRISVVSFVLICLANKKQSRHKIRSMKFDFLKLCASEDMLFVSLSCVYS